MATEFKFTLADEVEVWDLNSLFWRWQGVVAGKISVAALRPDEVLIASMKDDRYYMVRLMADPAHPIELTFSERQLRRLGR